MNFTQPLRRPLIACGLLLLSAVASLAQGAAKLASSPTLQVEARVMAQVLQQTEYNRDAVTSRTYAEAIPEYMTALDGQRMFFLAGDEARFARQYGQNLYWNVSVLGNIDAAYAIFDAYRQRADARVAWIFDQLKKDDLDLTQNDRFQLDRSKAPWPADAAAADQLWRERLKFELINELLNKKTRDEAREVVRKRYERMLKNLDEIDSSDLSERFLSIIAGLYGPHTMYFSADTYEDFGIEMKLELVGIGALLGMEDNYCVVREIVPGGPAYLNKQLKPNDRILAVAQGDGEPVDIIGMKLRKVVHLIRGKKGTKIRLIVQPAGAVDSSTRKEIVITRDVVKLNAARAHAAIFQVPDEHGGTMPIGVISLPSFYGSPGEADGGEQTSATADVANLIGQLQHAGIKGLVLDLRHNGGGYLTEAIKLTGLFINHGPVVQVKNYAGEIHVDSDDSNQVTYAGPLAVLVDRFSASASEIVTGALQDYGRAVIIGDRSTHGKGTVQTILEMKSLVPSLALAKARTGAVKLTVQKFYLPNGSSTQLRGITPDIILPSIDEYLPIGESSLPHVLPWDQIPSSMFDGQPIPANLLQYLQKASEARQEHLPEFAYLHQYVDWFKQREAEKYVSLNLARRETQKASDKAFSQKMETELKGLAKFDFPYKEFRLGPPLPPPIKPDKTDQDDDDDLPDLSPNSTDSYAGVDVDLKEALRVVRDVVGVSTNHTYWVNQLPPLTVRLASDD